MSKAEICQSIIDAEMLIQRLQRDIWDEQLSLYPWQLVKFIKLHCAFMRLHRAFKYLATSFRKEQGV
jgi:hypothetical protein